MSSLTYAEVGATETGVLPAGYGHLRYRTRVGHDVFAAAAEAVLTWRMHRAAGIRVETSADRAAPGVDVTMHIGPMRAPCRVVWAVDEPGRAGWGYGTLPGHPARGEEAFVVTQEADGTTWFEVIAFSVPASFLMRAGGPVARLFQRAYAAWNGRALRKLVNS
ncbi:DUF1990 domain-containing protein [Asanoa sp. WMMD1127]|uniref:DUF1990 family protein n=1 Tax=Asanoa sp. WMMD1127 TaxID=3016107 RepID=UPI00241632EF|nr:DUF1990 domain-containing protein [Asanoa sp. WMMD1127]MDG4823832.1 DUF1990 domain-containing protein [Asanoa sp. WMMD1127]